MGRTVGSPTSFSLALFASCALVAAPVALGGGSHPLTAKVALAHGEGGGGGGGSGGESGGGGGHDGGADSAGGGGHGGGSAGSHGAAETGYGGDHAGGMQGGAGHAGTSSHGSGVNGHGGLASHGAMANALGALNAAHTSPTALAHAAPTSRVGLIAAYDRAMLAALAMPTATPREIAARNAAIAAARQDQLGASANKGLTPGVVAHVDALLGLPPTNPTLGVTQSDVDATNAWR